MSAFSVSMEWKFFCNFAEINKKTMNIYHNVKPCNLSNVQNFYFDFWEAFNLHAINNKEFNETFPSCLRKSIRCYEDFCFNHCFHIVVKINLKLKEAQVGAYFSDISAYLRFYEQHRPRIESRINYPIEWTLWKTKASAYIKVNFDDFYDKNNWNFIFDWLIENAIIMKKVFCSYD